MDDLKRSLRPLATAGLPISPSLEDATLLGLRGVVARSIDPKSRHSRIKALNDLLTRLVVHYPSDNLGLSAQVLFGIVPGTRGKNLTYRRQQAADIAGYEIDHFRKRIEPQILEQLAWQLHLDSQNYIPRSRTSPPPLEATGDTPVLLSDDISSKDAAEHQELLSRLWAHVYALRADILKVERLKVWPYDPTEPVISQTKLQEAMDVREKQVKRVKLLVQRYIDTYGQRITHGEAEFNAQSLLRLAGWNDDI
ncbi:hypothetical protein ACSNO4_05530 [Kocuria flava]|uniref:hypothetical protein n=1 Tax=Kocuria flava TaxID=446860 RepID=UPI003F1BDF8E